MSADSKKPPPVDVGGGADVVSAAEARAAATAAALAAAAATIPKKRKKGGADSSSTADLADHVKKPREDGQSAPEDPSDAESHQDSAVPQETAKLASGRHQVADVLRAE